MEGRSRTWLWVGIGGAVVLVIVLFIVFTGGEEAPTTTPVAQPATTQAPPETTAPPATTAPPETTVPMIGEGRVVGMAYDIGGRGDKSFNDLAALAWDTGMEQYGYMGEELTPTAGGENREENLRLLAETGHEWILANGFAFAQNVFRVATEFPEVFFAITDACPADEAFATVDMPNVACLLFAEHEGSFLVGAIAGLKTETNDIGFIGGVDVPLIRKFQAGFEAGVRHVNPIAAISDTYLTQPPDFSGFNDPAKGNEAARAMLEGNADIVYHAAGGSGTGMFEAIKEHAEATGRTVWGIGVDADQFNTVGEDLQPWVLTSMLKRVDVAVFGAITEFLQGNFVSGANIFDLSRDGVGYSQTGGFVDDISDEIDALKVQIINGTIVVPETLEG
ncbi:MAG: BMP family protein [Acidimicrobiia bacterium]